MRGVFFLGGGGGVGEGEGREGCLKTETLADFNSININVLGPLTDEELLQECPKSLMELLDMVVNLL